MIQFLIRSLFLKKCSRWGWLRFAVIYFLCGIGGCMLSCIISPFVVGVGASGALFGIVGADIPYLIYNW